MWFTAQLMLGFQSLKNFRDLNTLQLLKWLQSYYWIKKNPLLLCYYLQVQVANITFKTFTFTKRLLSFMLILELQVRILLTFAS